MAKAPDETVTLAEAAAAPEAKVEAAVVADAGPVEDLSNLSNKLPASELAKLDETDPVAAAALRSQANWERDSKTLFKEETADERARKQLISDMDARDAKEAIKRREDEAARAKADELARIDDLVAEQEAIKARLTGELEACADELKRLAVLRKGG